MRGSRLPILAAALFAAACSHQKPAVTPAPSPFPATFTFTATTSADSAMEGRFEGSAVYDQGWLTVSVPRTSITVPPGNSENWRNLTVRAFVATNYQRGEWKAVAQSRPVNVFRFLNFGHANAYSYLIAVLTLGLTWLYIQLLYRRGAVQA